MPSPEHAQPAEPSIEALCAQARAGDEPALELLLRLHHRRFSGFLARKIRPELQGKIDVDDVLQEAYILAFRGVQEFTFQHEESFYRWGTFLVNRALIARVRQLRSRMRDVTRETAAAGTSATRHESFLARVAQDSVTPSRVISRDEVLSTLMSAIARLPEDYRVVVRRLFIDEEPLEAIAADMQRSTEAVRRMGTRAIERLRETLRSTEQSHWIRT